jgi:CrcB protein
MSLNVAILWVGLGSALGGMARYVVAQGVDRVTSIDFPMGTLVVNGLGSLLIGCLAIWTQENGPLAGLAENGQRFLMMGVMGGFTTFSSFSLQTLQLIEKGHFLAALINVVSSVLVCLMAVALGTKLATHL